MRSRFGIEPNVISCNAAVSACEKANEATAALKLLANATQPDVISFSAALAAQTRWPQGLGLLGRMGAKQAGSTGSSRV